MQNEPYALSPVTLSILAKHGIVVTGYPASVVLTFNGGDLDGYSMRVIIDPWEKLARAMDEMTGGTPDHPVVYSHTELTAEEVYDPQRLLFHDELKRVFPNPEHRRLFLVGPNPDLDGQNPSQLISIGRYAPVLDILAKLPAAK